MGTASSVVAPEVSAPAESGLENSGLMKDLVTEREIVAGQVYATATKHIDENIPILIASFRKHMYLYSTATEVQVACF
jgi:hypothetical protein